MSDLVENPPPKVERKPSADLNPTFIGSLRGVWLLTWKSQLTWQRVPVRALIAFVALPFLIFITVRSPDEWSKGRRLLNDPIVEANVVKHRGLHLNAAQEEQLLRVVQEEYDRAEAAFSGTNSLELSVDEQRDRIGDYYDHVDRRAAALLDQGQMAQFRQIQQRNRQMAEMRVRGPFWSWTSPFYHLLINLYFFIILPLHCVRACGALIRDDLQSDTLCFLATRPMNRATLLVTKYLAQTAWLQIVLLIETALLIGAGFIRHIPSLGALVPILLAVQFLAVFAWSALGTFLGMLTKRYVALALVYGVIVELGIGRIPTNINKLSVMRHLTSLLAHNPALESIFQWTNAGLALPIGALILATAVFLSLAVILFTFLEYHPTSEMQK